MASILVTTQHLALKSPQEKANEIADFWQSGEFSRFLGTNDIEIAFAKFIRHGANRSVVISPGRCESYLKYQELAFQLAQLGCNIFIIDHRGQGLSGRMASNRQKGHVDDFDHYAHDLNSFITSQVLPYCINDEKPYLLAHSMGGAIAIRTLQLYPDIVHSALLNSPMIAINTGGIPNWLARTIARLGLGLNQKISKEPWYFFGQGDYQAKLFGDNELMQSRERYARFINLYEKHGELKLGGVTFSWLSQALQANLTIFSNLDKIVNPITLIQAGADTIVDNQAQQQFIKQLNKIGNPAYFHIIEHARHETLFELDIYRDQALAIIENWLAGDESKT